MVQVFTEKVQGIDTAALEAAVVPILRAHGVQTAEISHQREQGGWILRVTLESLEAQRGGADLGQEQQDGGIDVGLCAEVSRDLSTALDVADLIPHHYTLEVSSPGLERPLRNLSDFQRSIGLLAKVHLSRPAADGQRVLRGRLTQADATAGLTLVADGKTIALPLADIARAHTVYELPAQPKRNRPTKKQRH